MKIARNCSSFTLEGEDEIPTFQIIKDRTYLMSCYEVFKKAFEIRGESQFLYNDVWSLCNALWGPGRTTAPFVKHRLSSWYVKKSANVNSSFFKLLKLKCIELVPFKTWMKNFTPIYTFSRVPIFIQFN